MKYSEMNNAAYKISLSLYKQAKAGSGHEN